ILDHDGLLNWSLGKVGLPAANIAYTNVAVWLVFTYIWLPFMIIPVYAALERIPRSTLEASADLGARGPRTFRSVTLPLALPGLVAGAVFTFALNPRDYVTPTPRAGPPAPVLPDPASPPAPPPTHPPLPPPLP